MFFTISNVLYLYFEINGCETNYDEKIICIDILPKDIFILIRTYRQKSIYLMKSRQLST